MLETSDEVLPFEMGYIPESIQKKVGALLNEYPETIAAGLQAMKEAIAKEKSMTHMELDDELLLIFLRYGKYDIKESMKRLKSMVDFKRNNMDMFVNQKFDILKMCFIKQALTILPYRCRDGCAVIHGAIDNWIPEEYPVSEVQKVTVIVLMQSIRDPMNQINGYRFIFDAGYKKNSPWMHLMHCTVKNLWLIYHGSQNCFPGRFHGYHVVNPSLVSRFCWRLYQPFMSQDVKSKIIFHSRPEELLDFIPSYAVPKQYGGELENWDNIEWLRKEMQPEKLEKLSNLFGKGDTK